MAPPVYVELANRIANQVLQTGAPVSRISVYVPDRDWATVVSQVSELSQQPGARKAAPGELKVSALGKVDVHFHREF